MRSLSFSLFGPFSWHYLLGIVLQRCFGHKATNIYGNRTQLVGLSTCLLVTWLVGTLSAVLSLVDAMLCVPVSCVGKSLDDSLKLMRDLSLSSHSMSTSCACSCCLLDVPVGAALVRCNLYQRLWLKSFVCLFVDIFCFYSFTSFHYCYSNRLSISHYCYCVYVFYCIWPFFLLL